MKVWRQIWADGRAVVYFHRIEDLRRWEKDVGKWLEPVGRPQKVERPKGVRVHSVCLALLLCTLAPWHKAFSQSIAAQVPWPITTFPSNGYNPAKSLIALTGILDQVPPAGGDLNIFPATGVGAPKQTIGFGISDISLTGTLNSFTPHKLLVKICAKGTPDTFDFALDSTPTCGAPTGITGGFQLTLNGIYVRFGTVNSSHTAGDVWTALIGNQTAHEQGWFGPQALSIGTGNAILTTFSGTFSSPPLPGSLTIGANQVIGKDNGSGLITGVGITAGTVNYTSGAVSVTFASAPATGVNVEANANFENCWADDTGQLNCIGGLGTPITFQTNSVNNFAQNILNLINGTGISIVNTVGGTVQISASGGGQVCTTAQLDQQHDIHASTTGNDLTGNGTLATPYRTVVRSVQDVPFLVCGRWVIHLDTTGSYVGQVNIAGRVFGGGGANKDNGSSFWPWSVTGGGVTDNTRPYSWLEIVGSTSASASYILEATSGAGVDTGATVISSSNANVTLRGLMVYKGDWGIAAENKSYLNLAGVILNDNNIGSDVGFDSHLHFDASGFVNDDGVTMVSVVNDNALGSTQTVGINVHDDSYMDDSDWTDLGLGSGGTGCTTCQVDLTSTGGGSHAFKIDSNSSLHLYGELNCTLSASAGAAAGACLFVRGSTIMLNQGTFTGGSVGTAIAVVGGNVSSDQGGAVIQLTNWVNGVELLEGSSFDGSTSLLYTGVTNKWLGDQGDLSGQIVRSRDLFMGVGLQPLDVSETGTFTPNLSLGTFWRITLTGNAIMNAPAFGVDGGVFKILVCQNGAGAHTLAFNAIMHGAGTISAGASTCSQQSFTFRSSTGFFYADAPMVVGM